MNQHSIRWGGTYTEWQANVQQLRDFINQRCDALAMGFMDCYPLGGPYTLVVNSDPPVAGSIKVNSVVVHQFPWTATYYSGIDTKFKAMPNNGFSFNHWSSDFHTFSPGNNSDSVKINLNTNDTIVGHYNILAVHEIKPCGIFMTVYPNVSDESFTIEYSLPKEMPVAIKLFTLDGRNALSIPVTDQNRTKGNHMMSLNLKKTGLSAGMYILNFFAGDYKESTKLIFTPQ
jgi:hypothetical protein